MPESFWLSTVVGTRTTRRPRWVVAAAYPAASSTAPPPMIKGVGVAVDPMAVKQGVQTIDHGVVVLGGLASRYLDQVCQRLEAAGMGSEIGPDLVRDLRMSGGETGVHHRQCAVAPGGLSRGQHVDQRRVGRVEDATGEHDRILEWDHDPLAQHFAALT